jgi:hypothetical protein
LLAFKSWHSALPWFPIANRAENAVALLVEMLADDHARRVVDDHTLAQAIALVGFAQSGFVPPASLSTSSAAQPPSEADAAAHQVAPRVARLVNPIVPLPVAATAGALTLAVALLTGTVFILFGA